MSFNAEYRNAFRERKCADGERGESEQCIIHIIILNNTSISSSTTGVEKYENFQSHRQTVKVDERKRKRAEAARERRKQERLKRERVREEQPKVTTDSNSQEHIYI